MCSRYAATRYLLYCGGKGAEVYVSYEPNMYFLGKWLQQLYGESHGKEGKGLLPMTLDFTSDLHSMGQYIQDGKKDLFETVLHVKKEEVDYAINRDEENLDELNYLAGKTMNYVNENAYRGVLKAHVEGDVPNIVIHIPTLNEYYLGKFLSFFLLFLLR